MAKKKKPTTGRLDEMFDKIPYEEPETSPRRNGDEVIGKSEPESAKVNFEVIESASDESEAEASVLNPVEDVVVTDESVDVSVDTPADDQDLSPEDLLDDVRRSLVEVEEEKEEVEKSKWWKRIGKRSRKDKKDTEPVLASETEIASMASDSSDVAQLDEEDEYVEQIDELIGMLDIETADQPVSESSSDDVAVAAAEVKEVEEKQEEHVDFAEMKKRAFHATKSQDDEGDFSEVRSVALEGGEEMFIEVESKTEDPAEERWKSFENALLPYRRYINFAAIFVGFITLAVVGVLVYDAIPKPAPAVAEPADVLPYPVVIYLPGDIVFNLGRGSLVDGRWNPRGPEWLEGTEICRWVAIPYSRQLEAVVRTLTREDSIELLMSNGDNLTYNVYSITQMTLDEMLKNNTNSPCLLLVLADAKTDERWVVTANP